MATNFDDSAELLLPRVAEMVRSLIEHQAEIERQVSGQVNFDYAPKQVVFSLVVKRVRVRLPREPDDS